MITTERLLLTPPMMYDAPSIFELRSDPEVAVYLNRKLQTNIEEAEAFITKLAAGIDEARWFYWIIRDKVSNNFLGTICLWSFSEDRLSAEVGYELLPRFQGKGYAAEALAAILEYGFTSLGLARIDGIVEAGNERSKILLDRFGFKVSKEFEEESNLGGSAIKCLVYSLERE